MTIIGNPKTVEELKSSKGSKDYFVVSVIVAIQRDDTVHNEEPFAVNIRKWFWSPIVYSIEFS
jgi:hypothetical protein